MHELQLQHVNPGIRRESLRNVNLMLMQTDFADIQHRLIMI
jgi:hypothetical protein